MTGRQWSVKHREGSCTVKGTRKPPDNADSVETVCGHFVILPYGYEQGSSDCPDCRAALKEKAE